jgi:peptidoglycan/LPS O-acetylase OafA/YrhL
LFFVLSGFLVTGLLIKERQRHGEADVRRFLIRRAFKIYPGFWVMIATSVLLFRAIGRPVPRLGLFCELIFFQNYGPGVWASTWSLAVEEHFYLGVAMLFAWLNRRAGPVDGKQVLRAGLWFLVGILVLRVATELVFPQHYKMTYAGTHIRIDALAFGSLLAFARAYAPDRLAELVRRYRPFIAVGAAVLVVPVFHLGITSFYVLTIGLTQLYLAAGGVLLLAIHAPPASTVISIYLGRALALIGRASYAIYIWQLLFRDVILEWLVKRGMVSEALKATNLPFVIGSVLLGIALTRLIDDPALALRDRWFPARARSSARL